MTAHHRQTDIALTSALAVLLCTSAAYAQFLESFKFATAPLIPVDNTTFVIGDKMCAITATGNLNAHDLAVVNLCHWPGNWRSIEIGGSS